MHWFASMASTDFTTTSTTPADPVSGGDSVGGSAVSASANVVPESGTPSTGNAVEDLQNPQMSTEVLQSASTVPK